MATLHILRTSGYNTQDTASLQRTASTEDAVILIDDGVYNIHSSLLNIKQFKTVYAIDEHLAARAIDTSEDICVVSMAEWVNLTLTFNRVITWQ